MNHETACSLVPRPLAVLLGVMVLLVAAWLLGIRLLVTLALGWWFFVTRTWSAMRADGVAILSGILGLALAGLLIHVLAAGFYPKVVPSRRWRVRWTVALLMVLVTLFTTGMSATALVHQAWWLHRSPRPLYAVDNVGCAGNMRQIGQIAAMFANDHGGRFPDSLSELCEYAARDPDGSCRGVFICPGSDDQLSGPTTQEWAAQVPLPGHCSYTYVGRGVLATDRGLDKRITLYETSDNHGHGSINVLYADGHVDYVPMTDLQSQFPAK